MQRGERKVRISRQVERKIKIKKEGGKSYVVCEWKICGKRKN